MRFILLTLILVITSGGYVDDAYVTSLDCSYIIPGFIEDFGFLVEGEPDKYTCHLHPPGSGYAYLYATFGGIGNSGITVYGYDECSHGILVVNFYRNGRIVQHSEIETEHCDRPAWKQWDVEAEREFDRLEFVVGPDSNAIHIDAIRAWHVEPFRIYFPIISTKTISTAI